MKLRTKSIITLVAMLLSGIGAFAEDGTSSPQWTVSYQYDGEASTSDAPGIVECTFSGTTATIVCRPLEGNYITAEDIIVEKTVSGDKAQTREVGIDSTPITITAASTNTTPRAESSYTFTAEADPNLTYEIKANFHKLKDLDLYALIALPENTIYTYTGNAIKPEFTVTAADVELTAETDYTVTYAGNVNAGQGSITITATETTFYTGSKTVNFDINQADVSFWFETSDGQEAKELKTTYGATFTKPVLKMSETGAADVIGVVYSVDNEEVATINATTGELTILKAGTVVVTAAAAEDYTNKEGSNYKADPANTKASYSLTINSATPTLQFSKETAEATMGAEFEAPTLTVTPEGLVPIEYESTNTEVATVDKNTGVVTLVGGGETTIKAVFPGNETYETALASYILTVSKVTATLKFAAETATATMGTEFAAPTLTVTPEGLQGVKYSSSNTNVATVNETTGAVTLVGAGEAVIKASFAGTTVYEAAEASYTLTVSKVTATLKFAAETATATMGAEFAAPALTVTPEGLQGVKYSSSNTNVATVNETTGAVTLVGAGETTIKATFAGNDKYEPAEASYKLTVSSKATMEVTATGYEGVYDGNAHGITVTAPEGATVKYGTEEGKYDLTENPTYTNVGTYTVYYQVTKEATETVTGSAKITINKATATLKFSAETATATLGAEFQTPTLTVTPEGLEGVKYTSSNTDVATVNETTGAVTLIGAGETTITAKFAGNDKYEPAEASYKLTVSSKATMEVSATGYEGVYDGNAHGITVTAPEGATVKYGTEEGKYDLTENPTYTNVGTYTVYYQVTKEATETVTGSAKITINKATATLKFSAETATATLGAEFQTPTLTVTPEGLEGVKYTSSNTDVATVNETTGAVTLIGAGEATITAKFAGNDNYEAAEASYTLTVNRAQSEGYGLWINDIQVTEDNYFDVLGNSTDSKSGTIVFNPEKNTLVMTNDVSNVEIESRLENLTLHINDVNKVKSIRFNNLDDATKTGKLAITTNGNFPGQIIITNDAGVSAISGFSEITLNMGLQYLEPELVEIENGELYKYDWDNTNSDNPVKKLDTKAVCDAVTIGVVITPLTRNVTVSMANASDYTAKDENGNTVLDENGNPKTVSMMNFAQNKDILLTLWTKNDEDNYQKGNDGDWPDAGFDSSDGDPGITMVITMTDAQALAVAASVLANTIQPGGTTYSMEFKGATFIVPAGSGEIDVWVKTDPGYVYKLLPVGLSEETHKLDFNSPSIKEYQDLGNGKIKVTVEYNDLPTQTYYMLYLAEEAPSGARGGTRLGKRDKAHGKLYSVGVRPRSITDVNPPSEASGGVIDEEEDPEGVIDNPTPPTPPTGIQTIASESSANSNKWFTADGRQLESKPTKPGFYIRNGKKVVIK